MEKIENKAEKEKCVKDVVSDLIEKMGLDCQVEIMSDLEREDDAVICNIKSEESSFLIGQYGVNLQSLQHIARLIVRKKAPEMISFVLDVNSYRQEKNQSVLRMAQEVAKQCLLEKRAVALRPMSAYERRIVHLELSKNEKIKTESVGEGEDRRVVVKPSDLV